MYGYYIINIEREGVIMKRFFSALFCVLMIVSLFFSSSFIAGRASLAEADVNDRGAFVPSAGSTWGDLYRHFQPAEFALLSAEEKALFDSSLLSGSGGTGYPVAGDEDTVAFIERISQEFMSLHNKEVVVSQWGVIIPE